AIPPPAHASPHELVPPAQPAIDGRACHATSLVWLESTILRLVHSPKLALEACGTIALDSAPRFGATAPGWRHGCGFCRRVRPRTSGLRHPLARAQRLAVGAAGRRGAGAPPSEASHPDELGTG